MHSWEPRGLRNLSSPSGGRRSHLNPGVKPDSWREQRALGPWVQTWMCDPEPDSIDGCIDSRSRYIHHGRNFKFEL